MEPQNYDNLKQAYEALLGVAEFSVKEIVNNEYIHLANVAVDPGDPLLRSLLLEYLNTNQATILAELKILALTKLKEARDQMIIDAEKQIAALKTEQL